MLRSVFNGTNPTGVWSLYVVDDDTFWSTTGSFAGGWELTIQLSGGDYAQTSGTLTFAPYATTATLSV